MRGIENALGASIQLTCLIGVLLMNSTHNYRLFTSLIGFVLAFLSFWAYWHLYKTKRAFYSYAHDDILNYLNEM